MKTEGFPPPPFEGFPKDALRFFLELSANQNKAWFDENKSRYRQNVQQPMAALVCELSDRLTQLKLELRGDPKRSVFRINRDVRFSSDKSPYKTNAGCALTRNGDKSSPGVLYFHLAPSGCFTAAGFYHPEPDALHRMRLGLLVDPKGWAKVHTQLSAAELELSREDMLIRLPRGYESAPPELENMLKLKSWIVRRAVPTAQIHEPALIDSLVAFGKTAAPLLRFGWLALDRHAAAKR